MTGCVVSAVDAGGDERGHRSHRLRRRRSPPWPNAVLRRALLAGTPHPVLERIVQLAQARRERGAHGGILHRLDRRRADYLRRMHERPSYARAFGEERVLHAEEKARHAAA
jgi:hypothetical protein